MTDQKQRESGSIDDLLQLLANRACRDTLAYFRATPRARHDVRDLAAACSQNRKQDSTQLVTQLHHNVLPKLDEVGALKYNQATNTVSYSGHSELEALLEAIQNTHPEEPTDASYPHKG